jgi:hypothetical protein
MSRERIGRMQENTIDANKTYRLMEEGKERK